MAVFDVEMSATEKQEWKADLEARLQQIESSDQQRETGTSISGNAQKQEHREESRPRMAWTYAEIDDARECEGGCEDPKIEEQVNKMLGVKRRKHLQSDGNNQGDRDVDHEECDQQIPNLKTDTRRVIDRDDGSPRRRECEETIHEGT